MAKSKENPTTGATGRFYANLEAFLEQEQRSAVRELFDATREKLDDAKGSKAAGAKKAISAIDKTEQLLHHLFDVKERLARETAPKGRK